MDPKVAGKFPDVYETNLQVLRGACFLRRCEQLKADPRLMSAVDAAAYAPYRPEPLPASSGAAEAPASVPMATLAPSNALKARANDDAALRRAILSTERDVVVEMAGGSEGLVRAVPMASLGAGSQAFMAQYGVQYPLLSLIHI